MNRIVCCLVGLLLTGCATTTPYQPLNKGVGYAEQRLETNRFRVSFHGHTQTPRETVENYLLYRIAELTLNHGYDYFRITSRNTEQELEGTGPQFGFGVGRFGFGHRVGFGIGVGTGGDLRTQYQGTADVILHRGKKPADDPAAYDAREVKTHLESTILRPEPRS